MSYLGSKFVQNKYIYNITYIYVKCKNNSQKFPIFAQNDTYAQSYGTESDPITASVSGLILTINPVSVTDEPIILTVKENNGGKLAMIIVTVTHAHLKPAEDNVAETSNFLGTTIPRNKIKSISFTDSTTGHEINNSTCFNVTAEAGSTAVRMWVTPDGNGNYDVTIGCKDGVYANEDCSCLFYNLANLEEITFNNNFNTSDTTNMHSMFRNSTKLEELDLRSFNTSRVTDMDFMFAGVTVGSSGVGSWGTQTNMALTEINLSSFDTSNVTTMYSMFANCGNLTTLDLSSFNTQNVTNMAEMFNGPNDASSKLESIVFGDKWNTSNVVTMFQMFCDCISLMDLDITGFNTYSVTDMTRYVSRMSLLN